MSVRKWLFGLVFVETLLCAFLMALLVGVNNTPQGAMDSAGRGVWFNSPLSREHYAIALSNVFSVQPGRFRICIIGVLSDGLLLGVCCVGAWLLSSESRWRWLFTRKFFASQIAWLLLTAFSSKGFEFIIWAPVWMPREIWYYLVGGIRGTLDYESFTDEPVVWIVVYPIWLVTASIVAFYHWRTVRGSRMPDGPPFDSAPQGEPSREQG